jgi:hypothetical protein
MARDEASPTCAGVLCTQLVLANAEKHVQLLSAGVVAAKTASLQQAAPVRASTCHFTCDQDVFRYVIAIDAIEQVVGTLVRADCCHAAV